MQVELHQLERRYEALRIVDPTAEARLMASLCAQGQQSPVLVVGPGADRYVLIDGYRRVRALGALGRDTVEALALPASEAEALMLSHRLESGRRRTALEEGWLIRELCETHGRQQHEVSEQLNRTRSWVSRRLGLVRVLPESVQERVRSGVLSAQGAMKYLLPLARANRAQCERLVERLGTRRLSTRQLARLYVGWKRGNEEQRRRIVEEPLLFLKVEEERSATRPPETKDKTPQALLLSDLESVAGLCWRARRRVQEAVPKRGSEESKLEAGGAWDRACVAFRALTKTMEERLNAGSGNAHSDCAAGC